MRFRRSRLVFTSNAIDEAKNSLLENEVTVELQDMGEKTKVTIRIAVTKAVPGNKNSCLQGMEMGWNQQTDKLGEMLSRSVSRGDGYET